MKTLASLILCLAALPAIAEPTPYFTGLTFGAALGATSAQYNLDRDINTEAMGSPALSRSDHLNLYANSPAGLVSLGYSYQTFNNFVIAGAFTAGYTDAKDTDQMNYSLNDLSGYDVNLNSETTLQMTNDFALLLKAGYVWQRTTLFYGLIGPRWGNFKTTVSTTGTATSGSTVAYSIDESASVSAYETGLTLGLGIQQLLTPRYSWALEYDYTTYGSISMPSTAVDHTSTKASTNNLMFMIAYRW